MRTQRGHPFAAGLALSKLSAFTVDDRGKETFATGGDLDRVKKVYCFGAH
jgi:vacuolar protein sorting-associated protein 13A/C